MRYGPGHAHEMRRLMLAVRVKGMHPNVKLFQREKREILENSALLPWLLFKRQAHFFRF